MIEQEPMRRFGRRFVGESLQRGLCVADRLLARRERVQGPSIELPERTDVAWDRWRKSKRTVNAGPNAPLLIRLVRYPYTMTGSPMVHLPRTKLETLPEREGFGEVMRSNSEAWARPQVHQPARGRLKLQSPARPDSMSWLDQQEEK
ncbi:MAG: hypothetical protein VXW32_13290 [Myxococcota bacterium]|jgi:hypothetical protein|nr:hypothetical protein [Myxococcota bacterium]